jgi:hypothetical protein
MCSISRLRKDHGQILNVDILPMAKARGFTAVFGRISKRGQSLPSSMFLAGDLFSMFYGLTSNHIYFPWCA